MSRKHLTLGVLCGKNLGAMRILWTCLCAREVENRTPETDHEHNYKKSGDKQQTFSVKNLKS